MKAAVGVLGAVLVIVGLALVGAGLVMSAEATQAEFNCAYGEPSSCASTTHQAQNTTVLAEEITGIGAMVAGAGFFFVAATVVTTMSRRAEESRAGRYAPPSVPPPAPPPF
jgi:hypothetical protein